MANVKTGEGEVGGGEVGDGVVGVGDRHKNSQRSKEVRKAERYGDSQTKVRGFQAITGDTCWRLLLYSHLFLQVIAVRSRGSVRSTSLQWHAVGGGVEGRGDCWRHFPGPTREDRHQPTLFFFICCCCCFYCLCVNSH